MKPKLILALCELTGNGSRFYREAGYEVRQYDIQKDPKHDVCLLPHIEEEVHGILAWPPCTQFAGSGARWWAAKGEQVLKEGLAIVDACLRAVLIYQPKWWALENPVGRLPRFIGPYRMTFQPYEYGGWIEGGEESDGYTKRTCMWGEFNIPEKRPVPNKHGSKMHLLPPSPERANLRSATPFGFSRAFFEANP